MKLVIELTLDGNFDKTGGLLVLLQEAVNDFTKHVPPGRNFSELQDRLVEGKAIFNAAADPVAGKQLYTIWMQEGEVLDPAAHVDDEVPSSISTEEVSIDTQKGVVVGREPLDLDKHN